MQLVPLLDITAGCALAAVAVIAFVRGPRPLGWALAATASAWFAGAVWASGGLAHRVPFVIALVIAAATTWAKPEAVVAGALTAGAGLSAIWSSAWSTIAFGAGVGVAASAQLARLHRRGADPAVAATIAATMWSGALIGVGMLQAGGAPAASTSVVYSLAIITATALLLRHCLLSATPEQVISLAAVDADGLTPRLRGLVGDPRFDLTFGDTAPASGARLEVIPLRRAGTVVGTLKHSRGRRIDRRLVEGLAELAGLFADARELRDRSVATRADLDAAEAEFLQARARSSAELGERLRSGPVEHLSCARAKLDDDELIRALDAARDELASVGGDLADPASVGSNWRTSLDRRIALSPIPVACDLPPELPDIPDRIGREALLGCSEALSNAAKHSSATSIRLSLTVVDRMLHVEVADDGSGGIEERGFGLRGIRERAERLGGGLALDSRAGAGTLIHFWLPCEGAP